MFKKISFLILSLVLLTPICKAATTDTTPPSLNNFVINGSTYKPGDIMDIIVDATDDISGVDSLHINFQSEDRKNNLMILVMNFDSGKTITKIEGSAKPGTYHLMNIYLYDRASNFICRRTSFSPKIANCTPDLEDKLVNIVANDNIIKPSLENVRLNKKEFNVGETLEITAAINSANGIKNAFAMYGNDIVINLNNIGGNVYKGSTVVTYPTDLKFNGLRIIDGNSDQWTFDYVKDNVYDIADYICTIANDSLDVLVKGERDTSLPKLESVTIKKSEISAPGVNTIEVIASDNLGIKSIQVDLKRKGTDGPILSGDGKLKDGKFTTTISFDQYIDEGEYFIENIYITDTNSNMIQYSTKYEEYKCEPLGDYTFKVVKAQKVDETISTSNDDAVDKVTNAKDDAIIAVDSTRNSIVKKEMFEAIKGTNKTLFIESNGIQWIFYGQDIKNEIKDIDVNVNIYQNNAIDILNENSLVIDFAPNGLLPGIAKVKIKAEYTFRDIVGVKDLYVYYYDEEKEMFDPVAQKLEMTEEGYYEFFIEHNSKYVITGKSPNKKYISTNKSSLDINNQNSKNENYNVDLENTDYINVDNFIKTSEITKSSGNNLLALIGGLIFVIPVVGAIIYTVINKKKKAKKLNLDK